MNEIVNTHDMAEQEWDGHDGPQDVQTAMAATHEPEGRGIEFHVSMHDYTQRDMEALIVEAAAMQIVGKFGGQRLAKAIETKCIELIDAKASAALSTVTTEIIDQPLTPSFGSKSPVTMREFIGLVGREYLTEHVNHNGEKSTKDTWSNRGTMTRVEYLVMKAMGNQFKDEITKATSALISSMQQEFRRAHESVLAEQKARIRDALAKLTA